MTPHHRLTFLPNRHRARELRVFRQLVVTYFERSQRDPDDVLMDWEGAQEARASINQRLPRVLRMVEAAGLGTGGSLSGVTDPGLGLARADVLRGIFRARYAEGLEQEILDALDMAIGVYDGDRLVALIRTVNPFHYVGLALRGLARMPRRVGAVLGFGSRTPRRGLAAGDSPLGEVEDRLTELEASFEARLASVQDRHAMRQAETARHLAELAERLDFSERVLAQYRGPGRLEAPADSEIITPV